MRNEKENGNKAIGVELKYCEHCGALWVRERGAGTAYCERCVPKVSDLPVARKRVERVGLPVRKRTVVEDFGGPMEECGKDLKAMGGVA